jgi:hypothetical protein
MEKEEVELRWRVCVLKGGGDAGSEETPNEGACRRVVGKLELLYALRHKIVEMRHALVLTLPEALSRLRPGVAAKAELVSTTPSSMGE